MTTADQIRAAIADRHDDYLADLTTLCAIDSPSGDVDGIAAVGAWLQRRAAEHHWEVRRFVDSEAGDCLAITLRGSGHRRILLAAHMDTVYPSGTAAARPARRDGARLIAPGCVDNRAGLLSAIYAAEALERLGFHHAFGSLTIAAGCDEETDSRVSRRMFAELVPQSDLALILEPARPGGEIVLARKGNGMFTLEVRGRAAHAGVDPERGANANLALAHQIIALQALNDYPRGMTLNVGVISGGTAPNVVSDVARAVIDVRVTQAEDREPLEAAIRAITANPPFEGITCNLLGGWDFPPMVQNSASQGLFAQAQAAASELGFAITGIATGGISYGNLLSGLGLPCLDGLGPIGGKLHSPEEYIEIASIVPRTSLLALLILRCAEG